MAARSLSGLAVFAVVLGLTLGSAHANAGSREVVLGKRNLTGKYAIGWGTAHPRIIFNGGDPSGKAWNLRWSNWGDGSPTGRGLTWVARPNGGYYDQPGAIEMRAYRLGQCVAGGNPAYTRLAVRVARPGGAFGHWYAWGGWRTLCRWPS